MSDLEKRGVRGNQGEKGQQEVDSSSYTDIILDYYNLLLQRGYKYSELYEMTLYELKNALKQANKGLAYTIWKQAVLNISMMGKKAPDSPEKASPELYPPKKTYKMPEWMVRKYLEKGGK